MFNDDVNDTQERTKNAQKRIDFNDYLLCIRLEIKQTADFAGSSTTINTSKDDPDFLNRAIEILIEDGYKVDQKEGKIHISWSLED